MALGAFLAIQIEEKSRLDLSAKQFPYLSAFVAASAFESLPLDHRHLRPIGQADWQLVTRAPLDPTLFAYLRKFRSHAFR